MPRILLRARPRAQSVSGPLAATDIHGKTLALARVAACSIQDSLASTDQLVSQVPVPLLHQPFSTLPQPGDVLAANLAATTKFDVSIARSDGHLGTHQVATAKGRDLAQGTVRLVLDEGKTIGAVAHDLDLTASSLAN
jgi:hypothetical protein